MSLDWDLLVADPLFAVFGEAATYTPPGGSAAAVTVILDRSSEVVQQDRTAVTIEQPRALVRASDVPAPGHGDTLAVGTTTWRVLGPGRPDRTGRLFELDLEEA